MKPERQAWADGVKLGEVGFKVAFDYYDVGSEEFMLSFFSTVAYRLEKGNWGKRFPKIMKELPANIAIWDNDDPKKRPEYSEYGNQEAANLAEYFICTHGDSILKHFTAPLSMRAGCCGRLGSSISGRSSIDEG